MVVHMVTRNPLIICIPLPKTHNISALSTSSLNTEKLYTHTPFLRTKQTFTSNQDTDQFVNRQADDT